MTTDAKDDAAVAAETKRAMRWERWNALREAGAARFPGVAGRIPNFVGAEAAAARLAEERCWRRARVVKCNPDLPQRPVRARALREGKLVVMPAPKLAAPAPFVRLDPARIPASELWPASSIAWAMEHGQPVAVEELEPLDLFVVGSVAVAADGARLGKGGGYGDLELALLHEAEKLGPRVPIVTTVHATQLVPTGRIPMLPHDLAVDLVVTAEETLRCRRRRRPRGILWDRLAPAKLQAIPALRARRPPDGEDPRPARRRKA